MAVQRLGDATYEVYFKTRGGERFLCRARNITSVSWGRKMNDVSQASVSIALNGLDDECCDCIATINPWEHELAVFRNGIEVWVGPVVNGTIDLAGLTATYEARDLSAWFDHRWVEVLDTDKDFEEANISDVFTWLIEHAYYREPWNMSWIVPTTQIPIDRTYIARDTSNERWSGTFQNVGEEMRDLSQSGIDTTVIRRTFIAGDLQAETQITQLLTDEHWAVLPTINIVGTSMATEVGVGGGNGGYSGWSDDQIWIERSDSDDNGARYGLLQSFFNAPELDDEDTTELPNAVTQQAWMLREAKKEPFVYIQGGSLSPRAPVQADDLIPGNVYRVALSETCRPIESDYRLFAVNVAFGDRGETVSVEMTPLGADALRGE
jgi:hypothetical protein